MLTAIRRFFELLRKLLSKQKRRKTKPKQKKKKKKPNCRENCPDSASNPYKNRTKAQNQKAAKREKELIKEHEKKLDDYSKNPDKHDNQGLLKNAKDQATRDKIIQGRKKALQKQIEKHKKELNKIEEALKSE